MDRIRDASRIADFSWLRDVSSGALAERFFIRGFRVDIYAVKPTSVRHLERFRFRLLVFDKALARPLLSIGLESDILGEYLLSVQRGTERSIPERYDSVPTYEFFRDRAVRIAREYLAKVKASKSPADDRKDVPRA